MKNVQARGYITTLAAISVGVICSFLVVGSKVYIEYKAKLTGRIKEGLQIQTVMEAAAKVVRTARDTSPNPNLMLWPAQNPDCVIDCGLIFGGLVPRVCFNHPSFVAVPAGVGNVPPRVPGRPYCFFETPGTTFRNSAQINLHLKTNDPLWDDTWSDRFFVALGLGTSPQQIFLESPIPLSTAHALPQAVAPADQRADIAGAAPLVCNPGPGVVAPGCQSCGGPNMGTANPTTCANLELCPSTFPNCAGAGAAPLFRQTVILIPSGYQR